MPVLKAHHAFAAACALLAIGGCSTIGEEAAEAVGNEYVADLRPASGGSALGRAEIAVEDATNTICTELELRPGVHMTTGHILRGDLVVATLEVPGDNDAHDCDSITDTAVDAIRANPGAHRVHIAATTGDLWGTLRPDRD